MSKILILLGSSSDLGITEDGLNILKEAGVPFELRIASAHRSPEMVHSLVSEFKGGVIICVAGKSAHLAGVSASLTVKPVIAVPVFSEATSGFDALLSVSQMPAGIPVATMGLGKSGFSNACLLSLQILGLADPDIKKFLEEDRKKMSKKVAADDQKHKMLFRAPDRK